MAVWHCRHHQLQPLQSCWLMDLSPVGSAWVTASNCSFSALMLAASVRAMVSSVYKCASLGPSRLLDWFAAWKGLRSKLGIQHWNLLVCSTKQGILLKKTKLEHAVIRLGSTTWSNWSCNCLSRCCRGEALSAIQSARSLAIWLTIYF